MRVRQAFGTQALSDPQIADRLREMYADFHGQPARLLHRDQAAGCIPDGIDPEVTATGLAALAEGLAYYVLIETCDADTARSRVLAAIAELYC
jgi:alkylation response protein AidB-like acyl-CoA dehydrogenase